MNIAKQLYTLLLRLYPRSYRNAFGADMLQTFVDQYTDVKTSAGRVSMYFWLSTVTDELQNILRQYRTSLTEGHAFLRLTVTKLVVSAMLLIPLYPLCYAALVSAALRLPHPSVSGLGFLGVLAMVVLLAGIFSGATSYLLVSLVLSVRSQRKMSMS